MLCHAEPCCAMLCCAMWVSRFWGRFAQGKPCRAVPCRVMSRHAVTPCHAMSHHHFGLCQFMSAGGAMGLCRVTLSLWAVPVHRCWGRCVTLLVHAMGPCCAVAHCHTVPYDTSSHAGAVWLCRAVSRCALAGWWVTPRWQRWWQCHSRNVTHAMYCSVLLNFLARYLAEALLGIFTMESSLP